MNTDVLSERITTGSAAGERRTNSLKLRRHFLYPISTNIAGFSWLAQRVRQKEPIMKLPRFVLSTVMLTMCAVASGQSADLSPVAFGAFFAFIQSGLGFPWGRVADAVASREGRERSTVEGAGRVRQAHRRQRSRRITILCPIDH